MAPRENKEGICVYVPIIVSSCRMNEDFGRVLDGQTYDALIGQHVCLTYFALIGGVDGSKPICVFNSIVKLYQVCGGFICNCRMANEIIMDSVAGPKHHRETNCLTSQRKKKTIDT